MIYSQEIYTTQILVNSMHCYITNGNSFCIFVCCRDGGVSGNNSGLAAGAGGHPQAATPNMAVASRDYAMVSRRFITTTSGNDVRRYLYDTINIYQFLGIQNILNFYRS